MFKDAYSNGNGKVYNKNELIFEGEYLNGKKIRGKEYQNGKLIFEGEYLIWEKFENIKYI